MDSPRIRVIHVITRMVFGGAPQVVLQLAERIDRDRFETEFVCGEQDATLLANLYKLVPVERLPSLVREISPYHDLKALLSLIFHFRERKPHVVHGHTYKAGVLASIAARKAGVPAVIFTPHGHIFTPGSRIPGVPGGLRLRLLKMVTRYAQSCAHVVTALSEEDRNEQLSHELSPPEKYEVIRNGIDVARFASRERDECRKRWGLEGAPLLGSVGRLTEEKGHRFLIPMLKSLSGARLALVGAGPEKERILEEARREGVASRLTLMGEVESSDVLRAFDVYVHPSLYESQGLAILEAMAAGVPVVATRVGGVPGVVEEGKTGLLVPSADPSAMAEAVRRVWNDRELAQRVVGNARERVERDFSVDRMIREYENLYLRLLGRSEGTCTTTSKAASH